MYSSTQDVKPNYGELVKFLVIPFLDSPESVSVDCEMSHQNSRVWIRLAFNTEDKGRVFGRGGRNIQAIRAVIEAAAKAASQSVHLDIYGSHANDSEPQSSSGGRSASGEPPGDMRSRRPNSSSKPAPKPRPR